MKTKCLICNKRYAVADEWKSEREKVVCMTCIIIEQTIKTMHIAITSIAGRKGLDVSWDVYLAPKNVKQNNKIQSKP